MTHRTHTPADALANLGLGLLAGTVAVAGVLRGAGSVAAFIAAQPQPTTGIAAGVTVLTRPLEVGDALGTTGLNPILYWSVVATLLTILGAIAWWIWRLTRLTSSRTSTDPRRLVGTATRDDITRTASAKTLLRRAAILRPSLTTPRATDVGYLLGTSHGKPVWATVEDSILLIGPPRSGKGLNVVINAILDAPGAVITTSTRPDTLTVTLRARERRGPVAVFDPQHLAPGLPAGQRWSLVRGCADPLTAMIRATGLASSTNFSTVTGGDFWQGKTTTAIQALLHAAALDSRDAATLYQWALNPTAAGDAVRVLHTNPRAAEGWADSLDSMLQADPRTRDSIWQGVSLAFSSLADPRVLDAVTPRAGHGFDPETFLREPGTLYLLATGTGAGASAALVAALVEDLTETARRLAARSPGARMDPPLLMALDEIGNLAPLPSLPTLMAEGGGTGITTLPVLQSLAQARDKWGENQAHAIWDASIVKIVLGGASNSRDLQDLTNLIGDRDETTDSTTIDHHGGRSTQRSLRRVPVMPPDALRTLPFGTGVILLRTTRPIITTLRPWTTRKDAAQLTSDRSDVEHILRTAR